jgi:hypothetical protein
MRSLATLLVALFVLVSTASADKWSRKAQRQQRQNQGWTVVESPTVSTAPVVTPATPYTGKDAGKDDALDEVNAERAKRGLRAFLPDPLLNKAALACAKQRAARFIHGHLPESDFSYLPANGQASSAGCGALEPSWGWGTCCYLENYTYAGAAWVMGSDGRRYMHIFVR